MSREVELLTEIRDLLQVMAEPALAKRDEKLRGALRSIVGKSLKAAAAVSLMDGSRTQSAIVKESKIDQGTLSRLVKALAKASLVALDEKHPKLILTVPPNFFDQAKNRE
jgi:DNA-binding MarR family transcriptional regulator